MTHYRAPAVASLLITAALAFAACVASPTSGGSSPSTGRPASSPANSPAGPRATPTTKASASATPLPLLSPDEFWAELYSGDPNLFEYPSIGALIKDSDAVAVVRLTSVTEEQCFDLGQGLIEYNATVHAQVERVLHGSLPSDVVPISVVVMLNPENEDAYEAMVARLQASMPHEEGVVFLRNVDKWAREDSGEATSRYDPSLYQLAAPQGIIRNANGKAAPVEYAPGTWPESVKGQPFGSVVSAIASAKADS